MQLQLFETNDDVKLLVQEIAHLRQQLKKVKKEFSQRQHELAKWCVTIEEENNWLKQRVYELEKSIYPDRAQAVENERLLEKLFSEAYFDSTLLAEK